MDFFNSYLQTAQAQAKTAALSAQKSAKGFAQQMQEHTKVLAEHVTENTKILAEQASTLSSAAAESAQHKLRSLDGFKPPLPSLGKAAEPERPAPADLAMYGVTDELVDFVRSLTYSTFRDFPTDTLPPPPQDGGAAGKQTRDVDYLTPWQEHHAMLVVQVAPEINELRYVLCPKRMGDAQFWQIYFALAKKLLPSAAFDPSFVPPPLDEQRRTLHDLQAQLTRLSTSAKQWGAQTGATLRTAAATTFGTASSMEHANSLAATSGASPSSARSREAGAAALPASSAELGRDQELEAYLQDVMGADGKPDSKWKESSSNKGGAGGAQSGSTLDDNYVDARDGGSDDDEDDFEKYLHELSGSDQDAEEEAAAGKGGMGRAHKASGENEGEDSGDDLDLDEYMRVLADEDKESEK